MLNKILFSVFALAATQHVHAEIVNLVCLKPVDSEYLANVGKRAEEQCARFGDLFDACTDVKTKYEPAKKYCETAPFANRHTYTLDTSLLSSAPQVVEVLYESCQGGFIYSAANEVIEKAFVVASPSYLQLGTDVENLYFNVDRETLKAGNQTDRDFICTIEEVNTSANKI